MICNGAPLPAGVAEYLEFCNRWLELQQMWMQLYIDMLNNMVPRND
jgi:hypothetical protein